MQKQAITHLKDGRAQIAVTDDQAGAQAALDTETIPKYIDCTHAKPQSWTSLIHLAQTNDQAFRVLITLAKKGYLVYKAPTIGTSLVHRLALKDLWQPLKDNEYEQTKDGTVYKLTNCRHEGNPTSLAVVFSSVATNRFTQLLERHIGNPLSTLEKSVSGHTAVLRIADMDGVVGAYYLPTSRDPNSADYIQELIAHVADDLNLHTRQIVTYGVSKGATGALYHGLRMNSNTVAVDPIITLNRRNTRNTDPYFSSSSLYPDTFDNIFERLMAAHNQRSENTANTLRTTEPKHVIITAPKSEEYQDICRLVENSNTTSISLVESLDPHIEHHNEVGPNTVALALSMINILAQGLEFTMPARTTAR